MQTLLEFGLANAVMATVLAVAAACVGRLCHRPAVSHVLWLLVILKLVTPPLVHLPVAWPLEGDVARDAQAEQPVMVEVAPEAGNPAQLVLASADDGSAAPALILALQQEIEEGVALLEAARSDAAADNSTADGRTPLAVALQLAPPLLASVWVLGSLAWFAVAGIRIRRFQKLLRLATRAPEKIQSEVRALAGRMEIGQAPEAWFVPGRISPLLWALGARARLVLPLDLWQQLDPEQRSTLLAHELAHALRRDHWIRWLEFVTVGLYWWHPVAWWARHELQQAEEQCCDAWVVHTFPWSGKAYARALLQTVSFLDAQPALPPVASGAGHVHSLKRRLNMIVRTPLSPRAPWFVHVGAILAGLLLLPVTPLRLEACNFLPGPLLQGSDDDPPPDTRRDQVRQLEKRIRGLEDRLEQLLRKLDDKNRSGGASDLESQMKSRMEEARAKAEQESRRAEEMARDAMRKAEEQVRQAKRKAEEAARHAEERGREAAARAEKLMNEARQRSEDQVKRAQEKVRQLRERREIMLDGKDDAKREMKRVIELKVNPEGKNERKHVIQLDLDSEGKPGADVRPRIIIDGKVLDGKAIEQLHKQIEQGVHEAINPERIRVLEKQIQDTVQKSINPERMEQLQREIERAVQQSLNPQRMEALARQIESVVGRTLKDAEREKTRASERRGSSDSRPSTSGRARQSDRSADLEKRLDKLEKRLDQIIESLEKRSSP
jgi:beta-lactamase regulating signal transducer with metallopeptidase domain